MTTYLGKCLPHLRFEIFKILKFASIFQDMPSMENYLSASTSGAKSLLSNPPLPAPPVDLPPGFGTFPANGGFPNMFPFLYPGLNNFYPGFDLPFLPPQMMMSAGQ